MFKSDNNNGILTAQQLLDGRSKENLEEILESMKYHSTTTRGPACSK